MYPSLSDFAHLKNITLDVLFHLYTYNMDMAEQKHSIHRCLSHMIQYTETHFFQIHLHPNSGWLKSPESKWLCFILVIMVSHTEVVLVGIQWGAVCSSTPLRYNMYWADISVWATWNFHRLYCTWLNLISSDFMSTETHVNSLSDGQIQRKKNYWPLRKPWPYHAFMVT